MVMQRIHVLDEQIANLIAAGEVIERPASVVKELLENALDAGGTHVDIRIEQGGLQRISIKDNGAGMHPDDCALAFQRHATSKIRSGRDLFRILTLGFRGEALPSIASVAKVECISCADDSAKGTVVRIHGGTMQPVDTVAAQRGTTLDVRELFYNTPARLKYMKTVQTEFGQIADVVQRIALARPDVAITLYHDDHLVLRTSGRNDVREVIAAIYGKDVAKQLLALSFEHADVKITGFVSKPVVTRSNRHAVTWMVNGRYIRSTLLNQALLDGFHTLLPLHRYPIAAINLEMDPQLVDVNVHPAKWDVRFSKEAMIRETVSEAVKRALGNYVYIPDVDMPTSKPVFHEPSNVPFNAGVTKSTFSTPSYAQPVKTIDPGQVSMTQWGKILGVNATDNSSTFAFKERAELLATPENVERVEHEAQQTSAKLPSLQPVGQAHGTYIIAQDQESIYLIDQHAAHERINYEKFYQKFTRNDVSTQPLLVPYPFELAADESAWFQTILQQLDSIGLRIEPFGMNSFVLREHPEWFPVEKIVELARELLDWIVQQRKTFHLGRFRDAAAKMCACKASVRANERVSIAEMQSLLHQLQACDQPYTCPHGRPIIVRFSSYDLEKMFKRVM